MKFQELEARATPGKLEVHRCQDHLVLRTGPSRPIRDQRYVAYMTHGDMGRDDALLLAHCRNNFGKALAALKQAQRELDPLYAHAVNTGIAEAGDPPHRQVARAIAELEDVKEVQDV